MDRSQVLSTLATYIRAWVEQDPDLILTIFSEDASYRERAYAPPFIGHDQIRSYWANKVVKSQRNIRCNLLNLYIDGNTAIAEWEAEFDDKAEGLRKRLKEVAIIEFSSGLISELREYWASHDLERLTS